MEEEAVAHQAAIFDYRGAVPDTGASTVLRLGAKPLAARDVLLGQLEEPRTKRPAAPSQPLPAVTAR